MLFITLPPLIFEINSFLYLKKDSNVLARLRVVKSDVCRRLTSFQRPLTHRETHRSPNLSSRHNQTSDSSNLETSFRDLLVCQILINSTASLLTIFCNEQVAIGYALSLALLLICPFGRLKFNQINYDLSTRIVFL